MINSKYRDIENVLEKHLTVHFVLSLVNVDYIGYLYDRKDDQTINS